MVKTIKDGREQAKLAKNYALDHELEKLSGKAFSLSKTLREDPDVEAPVPAQYAVCFVRPVVGPKKTSSEALSFQNIRGRLLSFVQLLLQQQLYDEQSYQGTLRDGSSLRFSRVFLLYVDGSYYVETWRGEA